MSDLALPGGSVPLTGADCFLRAFDIETRRSTGANHLSQLVLRLGPGLDVDGLRRTLEEVGAFCINAFPHVIVPNKLLQEFRALSQEGGLELPFVDELAADIFMGAFSNKFVHAARIAG